MTRSPTPDTTPSLSPMWTLSPGASSSRTPSPARSRSPSPGATSSMARSGERAPSPVERATPPPPSSPSRAPSPVEHRSRSPSSKPSSPSRSPSPESSGAFLSPDPPSLVLYDGWKQTLPAADHQWVSKALFRTTKAGKAEFDTTKLDRLWYHPPPPSKGVSSTPRPDRYFASRLLVWMPRRLWSIKLYCPQPTCHNQALISAGTYPRVRQVADLDGYYSMATEYLHCTSCNRRLISWSSAVMRQLDVGHRLQFPALLTHRRACGHPAASERTREQLHPARPEAPGAIRPGVASQDGPISHTL